MSGLNVYVHVHAHVLLKNHLFGVRFFYELNNDLYQSFIHLILYHFSSPV